MVQNHSIIVKSEKSNIIVFSEIKTCIQYLCQNLNWTDQFAKWWEMSVLYWPTNL